MEERSAGAVLFRSTSSGRMYLLLRHHADRFDFPKGNIERGESEEQAALREVREETGLNDVRLIPGFRSVIEYFYVRGGRRVHKKVTYFLAEAGESDVRVSHEHTGFIWLPYTEALRLVSYTNSRRVLAEAEEFVRRSEVSRRFRTGREGASLQA